jgi:hypothetical protein
MKGRVATEDDVKAGRATFYFGNLDELPAEPAPVDLPALAWWPADADGPRRLCVVIQAERSDVQCTVGVRFVDGGNGVCLLDDLDFNVGTLAG